MLILFFLLFAKIATYTKQTILRQFELMQNILEIHGFIDIGPQSYEFGQNFKLEKIILKKKKMTIFTSYHLKKLDNV